MASIDVVRFRIAADEALLSDMDRAPPIGYRDAVRFCLQNSNNFKSRP
jgi:hypothetical protein